MLKKGYLTNAIMDKVFFLFALDISIIESTNADNTDTIRMPDVRILIIVLLVEEMSLYIDPSVKIFIAIGRTYTIVNRNDITPKLECFNLSIFELSICFSIEGLLYVF